MKLGLVFVSVLAFALVFSCVSNYVSAEPKVTIIPSIISAGSPALIKVDPQTTQSPMRVTWAVHDTGLGGSGSFPMENGMGICYFSDDDENATCGPTPFYKVGETLLYVNVVTPTSTTNKTTQLNISNIDVPLDGVAREDNTVYMNFFMGEKDGMTYKIYNEDMTSYKTDTELDYSISEGSKYSANITLLPGVYYFVFMLNDSGTYGGAMKKIEIPSGNFLTLKTNKEEYWAGENIIISGTSNADDVSGAIHFPDGSVAQEFSVSVSGSQEFSYEFAASSNWPEGEYEVKTDSPNIKSVKFTIADFFEIFPDSVSATVDSGDDYSAEIEIKNLRANSTNVTVETSGDVSENDVSAYFSEIGSQETATILLDISEIDSAIDGAITVSTSDGLFLSIPVSISVSGSAISNCPAGGSGNLEIDTDNLVWSGECVVDEEIYTSLLITNNGASEITGLSYQIKDIGYDQSFESLDNYGYVDFPLDTAIAAGDSEYFEITATPTSSGKYEAIVTISSSEGSAFFLVNLECFDDIGSNLEYLLGKVGDLNLPDETSKDIEADITNAQNAIALGNYRSAEEFYKSANVKVSTLESAPASGGLDLTWIIIIVVIIIIVGAVVWFMKFKQPQISGPGGKADDLEGF